ncbi:hypothetical protein Ct61P_06587 [Colletotrichum tofieldiae]|nr:hypothetical protein Ct61P_06587 [Colletotrichum tofieldiae]
MVSDSTVEQSVANEGTGSNGLDVRGASKPALPVAAVFNVCVAVEWQGQVDEELAIQLWAVKAVADASEGVVIGRTVLDYVDLVGGTFVGSCDGSVIIGDFGICSRCGVCYHRRYNSLCFVVAVVA